VHEQAVICFAEPRDPETLQERALFDASIETWTASRPDSARQVVAILVKGPWAQMTAQWSWTFGDDPGNADPGSALLLPTPDLPVLAKALAESPIPKRRWQRRIAMAMAMDGGHPAR
jgi:hypothetical protein